MRKYRSSILLAILMTALCGAIILGSTLAYFTSEEQSGENIIAASTLEAGLDWAYQLPESETGWQDAANGVLFNETSWEPNYSAARYIRIKNGGSLAFSYELNVLPTMVVEGGPELMDVIDVYFGVVDAQTPAITRSNFAQQLTRVGTMTDLIHNEHGAGYGILLPEGVGVEKLPAGVEGESGSVTACIVLHMQQEAGNEYMGLSAGEGFKLQLAATQYNYEPDAFGMIPNPTLPEVDGYGTEVVQPVGSTHNGILTADVAFTSSTGVTATVPAGAKVDAGVTELKLIVTPKAQSDADVTLQAGEALDAWEVRVEGLAKDNTVPVRISLGAVMQKALNIGNYDLYHVEGDATNKMTRVDAVDADAPHNSYSYDPATGEVEVAMATFSEVAMVASPAKWEGVYDYSWYTNAVMAAEDDAKADYIIANADQLAGFSAIVGGMDGQEYDSFKDKTVKLIADIDLGDKETENNPDLIFYPIGYNNSTGRYTRTKDSVTSGVKSFEGTFDGNGHTISNFYQNTWEMLGDYNEGYSAGSNYYKDGMGLFGYVVNGKICNLTVDNFISDGEFTPTGVIAAYTVNSTFENIAITNCNPRVYNTGNGGIVGIGGNSDDPDTYKLTFTNITIDNTNKITALWGSWDVACGGLVGMFRGDGHVHMTNCHVAAQMDVYNDVCGNYQYYWYRYSGMMVGTNMNMTTDDEGYTVPETDKFHAEGCTVHFGEWNDYYYCELVANSLASYTHDHQFSRLEQVDAVDLSNKTITIGDVTTAVPTSGRYNYVVVNGEPASDHATCYHFVDGAVWNHTDAGYEDGIDENGDGYNDLKEDKQHIYRPFNQLFTGYGWGVKHIPIYDDASQNVFPGVKILDDRKVADSVAKFVKAETAQDIYSAATDIHIGELFAAAENSTDPKYFIKKDNVQVFVSPVGSGSTVSGMYSANTEKWVDGTLTFYGKGSASVTITDYYFCEACTIYVTIEDDGVLYRVGNMNEVTYAQIAKLLTKKDSYSSIEITNHAHDVEIAVDGEKVEFKGTGIVKVIVDGTPYYLEVVEAENVITAKSATSNNVVLLNDCGLSSLTISGRYAFYGNGFTATYTGNGQYLNNGLKHGIVTISDDGTLDNLRIVASIYPAAYLYYEEAKTGPSQVEGPKTRYYYQLSAVAASGNATISNCYVYGSRTNIYIGEGDVTVKDTVLECGTLANVQIQSSNEHTVTFENVTTIQHRVNATIGDTSTEMIGAGIIVGPDTDSNPNIVLKGDFKQYNWVTAIDREAMSGTAGMIIQTALDNKDYNHIVNGSESSNMGIVYMNEHVVSIDDATGLPYKLATITMLNQKGQVYSLQNANEDQIFFDYVNADRTTENDLYKPQLRYKADLGGQFVAETVDGDEFCYREDDTIKVMFPTGEIRELDLAGLVNIQKYSGQNLNLSISCKDKNGDQIPVTNGKLVLSTSNDYVATYSVTDELYYDANGNVVSASVDYSWEVEVSVALKDAAVPNAYFEFDSTKQVIYRSGNSNIVQFIPFLSGLKIFDYNGQVPYLRFDGDNDFAKIAKASINNINTSGEAQGNHIVTVELTDGGKLVIDMDVRANTGSSTHSGSIKTRNNVLYVVNNGTTSGKGETWKIYSYKFVGNNGTEINSGLVTFGTAGVDCTTATKPTSNFGTTIKYTVTYNPNEGNCGQAVGYATNNTASVTLPTPSRSGYVFAGWYTAASNGMRVGGAGDSYAPTADVTLYAQWGKPCTVTYDPNGGMCDVTAHQYDGSAALSLPAPTHDNYWFIGWYDAETGGNFIGLAGDTFNPSGNVTLYARWQEMVKYTVTYDANGGTCSTATATYEGTALMLPSVSKIGSKFLGWYTAASDGTKIGDAGAAYIPSSNVTLYAQWEKIAYTITVLTSNATVSGVTNGQTAYYGDTITFTVTYSGDSDQKTTVTDENDNTVTTTGSYTFTMPASNVTISSSSSCVTPDTLITLADGTQKRVDSLTGEEQLLVWNMETGSLDAAPILFVDSDPEEDFEVIHLFFSDGTEVKVIYEHGFWDYDLNKYVYLDRDAEQYIGHWFFKLADNGGEKVQLVDVKLETEATTAWSPVTVGHLCYFVDGMLSMPGGVGGLFNIFDVDPETMTYDQAAMMEDIQKYGLFTYEELNAIVELPEAMFEAAGGAYLKVSLGKDNLTMDELVYMIERYKPYFE